MVLLVVNRSVEGLEAFALNSNGTLQTEGLADFGLCLMWPLWSTTRFETI